MTIKLWIRLLCVTTLVMGVFSHIGLSASQKALAASTLAAGDIAIIGFNFDNADQFAFVLLTDVEVDTQIKFTDNGWLDTNTSPQRSTAPVPSTQYPSV